MKNSNSIKKTPLPRPRIALITNHGYAGVEIPVGGAPDTGGQIFYVNALAKALEALNMDVTIFARGGFPFYAKPGIRAGVEQLSAHVRYVYVPGGGDAFIAKEDIAIALYEEAEWLGRFICEEAQAKGVAPWEYFECINTHYWDAAVIGIKLVQRWQDQIAYEFIKGVADGALSDAMGRFDGNNRHKLHLSKEVHFHMGQLARTAFHGESAESIVRRLSPSADFDPEILTASDGTASGYRTIEETTLLGAVLLDNLQQDGRSIDELYMRADRHIWTPHSFGIIKERNFWGKPTEMVRKLKFCERNNHEEVGCLHTPLFCSTSPEIWKTLYAHHGVDPEAIFDFPPCIDTNLFRPRTGDELSIPYDYLSRHSGVPVEQLKAGRIVFESSRMDRTKRKDVLLDAFAPIAADTTDTYLFIGGGPKTSEIYQKLEAQRASLPSLRGRAFLLGHIPRSVMPALFSVPAIFASASEMEGFGMSVSQAAAAKVPIVSSNLVPFATQYCGDAAIIVKAGDIEGFSTAIRHLLDNPSEREARAENLYLVARRLNWNTTASAFVDWYRERFDI